MIKRILDRLSTIEIYTVSIFLIYAALTVLFWNNDGVNAIFQLPIYFGIIGIIFFVAKSGKVRSDGVIRKFYLLAFVYLIYDQVHIFIPHINSMMFDDVLIKADQFLFGCNPTEWIYQFENPFLTEFLQFCYMTFFFLPIIQGVELHFRKKDVEFSILVRQILFGFYVSYLLYFFMPAVGPRFSIHDFFALSNELPGVFMTEHFRNFINSGGGITPAMTNPELFVNRDCMPSGHTMMTLMNIWLAFKFKSKLRYGFLFIGSGLILATVYLRYHYVVDLIAGAAFAFIVIKYEPYLNRLIEKAVGSRR